MLPNTAMLKEKTKTMVNSALIIFVNSRKNGDSAEGTTKTEQPTAMDPLPKKQKKTNKKTCMKSDRLQFWYRSIPG